MVRLGQCAWGAAGLMRLDCSWAAAGLSRGLLCPGCSRAAALLAPLAYRSIWAISRAQ